jgi:hypothetical protein
MSDYKIQLTLSWDDGNPILYTVEGGGIAVTEHDENEACNKWLCAYRTAIYMRHTDGSATPEDVAFLGGNSD